VSSLKTIVSAVTFLVVLAPSSLAFARECAAFDTAKSTGEIANDAVGEASGMAASWRHKDLLWVHNDSGDSARLFLMKQDGSHVATVTLEGVAKATDWEDMAVGPCQPASPKRVSSKEAAKDDGSAASCVYVGDIGDNASKREQVVIHRFEEPALPEELPADITVKATEQTWFHYPDGARDAEALMVHPKTAEIYVVDKRFQGDSSVYRIPRSPESDKTGSKKAPAVAVEVGRIRLDAQMGFASMITAGDISPGGTEFTVRTYLATYTFCADGDAFESALKAQPVTSKTPFMLQSEALGYDRGGEAIWITSERRPSPMYRMERRQD
jgi:hypothetical protein